jgi:hypothetical protein
VLYNNPWQTPGPTAWQAPAGVRAFGAGPGSAHGDYEQARRRRRLLMGGLAVGTAAAIAVIGIIVANMGNPPTASSTAAETRPAKPTAISSPTTSPSPTESVTAPPGAVLADGQSGLSYTELPSPWQGTSCPATGDNGAFNWTAGESAVAGPVNNGQTTWYGEACSGPLPLQYSYSGVASLQSVAVNLAGTFMNSYYNPLDHTSTQEVSQPISVSGHAGWEVTYQVSYTNPAQGATWTDEQAAVVVVDTGTGNTPAVFFASVPGNLDETNVATLVASLQLSAVPPASMSTASAAGGNPSDQPHHGDGGGGGNNP